MMQSVHGLAQHKIRPLLWLLGAGPLWTVWLQVWMPSATVSGPISLDRPERLIFYSLFGVQWLVVALWGTRFAPLHRRYVLLSVTTLLSSAGLLAYLLVLNNAIGLGWLLPAVCLAGLSQVPLSWAWGELYGDIGSRLTGVSISGSLLVHVGLSWLFGYLEVSAPFYVVLVLLPCMPLASYIALVMCRRSSSGLASGGAVRSPSRLRMPTPILGVAAVYGVCLGLVLGFSTSSGGLTRDDGLVQTLCVGVVALPLFLDVLMSRRWSLGRSYWPVLPLVGAGLLLLPMQGYRSLALGMTLAGWAYCMVLMDITFAEIVHRLPASAAHVFGWGSFANSAGVTVGFLVQTLVVSALPSLRAHLSAIAVVLAVLLMLLSSLLLRERTLETLWGLLPEHVAVVRQEDTRRACQRLAAANRLTPRETEILEMLAVGRDTDYISRHLVLSRNTIRVHTTHVYSKLAVHSRQDLIDVVQQRVASGAESA